MIFRHDYRHGTWVDLEQPTEDEIRTVAREFSVGERIESELLSPTPAPLVVGDGGSTLLVLHFPAHADNEAEPLKSQELDFVIGKRFVLTVRYEVIAPLHELRKILETEELMGTGEALTTDVILELLFAHLYEAIRDETRYFASKLSSIERAMFSGHERESVRAISGVSRGYLHLESTLRGQEEPLERFLANLAERNFFGPSFGDRSRRILADEAQVLRLVGMNRAVATELRETNKALLESRQNEIMKTLTVVNFIFLPLELIAFVFGMHALGTPLEANPNAFWIIVASMVGIVGLLTIYFARKRWIF